MLKVCVIGGGSTYTPELIMGFIARMSSFPITELCLMDIDQARLEIVGNFSKRLVENHGAPFQVRLTTDQREAISGSSYVLTQLRVGKMAARREDEYLGKRHGLIGQETTGIGGMAKALRTIPVILNIADDMRSLTPQALLVNFTNPSGLVTQALSMFAPDVQAVGVCNVAITTKMEMLEQLSSKTGIKFSPDSAHLDTLGLNHLSWHRGLWVDGVNYWKQVLQGYIAELLASDEPEYPPELIKTLGLIPNYYLQYFYSTDHKLEEQDEWPPSRAEEVMLLEHDLLREYADPALREPPADLMKRGGAYYSTVATQLLNAHYNNLNEVHVVNVRHGGAVNGWPEDWVLEMPCMVNRSGIRPLPADPLPVICFGLLAHVKSYELLAAQAAVTGDRKLLYQALLANPLGPKADHVTTVMDDLLLTHRQYLPLFWKS